jgi:hypothetical protein
MNPDPEPRPEREANMASDGAGSLDRAVQHDLDLIRAESMLARQDAVNELTREINESLTAPLALSEIASSLDRLEGQALPSFSELENLLASPEMSGLAMERNLLAELLKDGAEGQKIIKRGLVFLKHRRYAEAAEWWTLHRRDLDPATSRLSLLLLVMETLTQLWSGNRERAEAVRGQVTAHPLFRSIRSGSARG